MTASVLQRLAVAAGLLAALVIVIVTIAGGGSYTLNARFPDAGQLVRGGLVEVAGRNVGKIKKIELTNDGEAKIAMSISDKDLRPLHEGTRASIRAVGLSSVANRFIELSPGPGDAKEIKSGGTLDMSHTRGIVDLDQLLDSLDEPTRARLQGIISEGARTLAKPTDGQLNKALSYLNPALAQIGVLGGELTADQAALSRLVATASDTATALAKPSGALGSALASTSRTLDQLASHRGALGDSLQRASTVFGSARTTLRDLQQTLPAIDPLLVDLRPTAPKLSHLLTQLVPVTKNALPTFDGVLALLPKAKKALHPVPALAAQAAPALASGAKALKGLEPIVAGLRPYSPDLVAGLFAGLGGSTSGYYDANGHFARVSFAFGAGGLPGLIPAPPSGQLGGFRTGLTARCPGSAAEPAADNSNPLKIDTCNPAQTP
jgi:phospholipid/cholesterol/gamma-HCH transport system substrate-binding protein